ncbi:MAG: restriction endonuclease subunit S [Clostridium sp.]|nr:restriction endonuclease subunit S [Clostridium sp.]
MSIKISDICDINSSNISSKDNYEFINYLDTSNLTEGVIDTLQKLVVGEDKIPSRAKRKVKKNDVLISTVRPNQKHYGILRKLKENLIVSTGFVVLSAKEDIVDAEYLYRYLTQDSITNYLQAIGETSTSAYPSIKPSDIGSLEIELPQLEEQKAIAKVLLDLDQKIEINNKINKKLEEMAQTIFKQWFVDFEFTNEDGKPYKSSGGEMSESEQGMIPKGWEYKKLDDVLNTIEAGNRPKGGAGNLTEGIPSIGAENIIGLGKYDYSKEKFVTEDYFNSMKKGIVQSKDVLLYKDGAQLGRKTMFMDGFPHEKCCINSHVFILRSNNSISQSYLYFWLDQDYMTQNIINLNANSAQPGINQIQVKSLNILVPTKEIIEKFELTVNSLLDKLFANCKENTKLANIRDTLLPKLMSGEIRVPLD